VDTGVRPDNGGAVSGLLTALREMVDGITPGAASSRENARHGPGRPVRDVGLSDNGHPDADDREREGDRT